MKLGKILLRFGKGLLSEIPGINLNKTNRDSNDNGQGNTSLDRLAGQITAVIVAVLSLLEGLGVINLLGS